jgi:hypothetical protein
MQERNANACLIKPNKLYASQEITHVQWQFLKRVSIEHPLGARHTLIDWSFAREKVQMVASKATAGSI